MAKLTKANLGENIFKNKGNGFQQTFGIFGICTWVMLCGLWWDTCSAYQIKMIGGITTMLAAGRFDKLLFPFIFAALAVGIKILDRGTMSLAWQLQIWWIWCLLILKGNISILTFNKMSKWRWKNWVKWANHLVTQKVVRIFSEVEPD